VKIDRTAPVTVATAPPAWNNVDVTVNLSPSDALSGVAATHWSLDGGASQTGTNVPVTTEGDHTLSFSSVDNADNAEASQTIHVRIDKAAPTIGHNQSPLANFNGWNKTNVTVTFTCADALSGIASCTTPQTVTTEGQNQSVVGSAVDNAGNIATDPATVSIDKTKPTITSARDHAPNANGWYDTNVSVTYTCADALSGVDTCAAPQTFSEGTNQTATGSVTDAAGNSDSVTDTGINVDETPPAITGAPTTSPNANGWYNGDVAIHWTCSDARSGVAACPPDTVITGSGAGLTVTAAVSDLAGNTTVGTSTAVDIDRVAPTTTSDAPVGWQTADVTVHFVATDDLSGIDRTFFALNHGPAQSGSGVAITTEGMTLVEFWSVDAAGNVESPQSATVLLDKSVPTISHTQLPPPNANGWNNTSVDVGFTCADTISGVATCSPGLTLPFDGAHQIVTGTAIDIAGNSATNSADVSIDQTKPTISGAPDRASNANGWYHAGVTVSFGCADALSGVASCSGPATLGEGAGQSVSGDVADNADNAASTTVSDLNIDETAPTISGAPTTSPNAAGWYRGDVAVEWTCADALSGIDGPCPPHSTISGEGANLGTTASTADKAGNAANATVDGIHIDRTTPSTDASSPSDWVDHAVTIDLTATDNLSGVAETHYVLDGGSDQTGTSVSIATEGVHSLDYWSVDVAGNEEIHHHATVLVDLTAPTISHTQSPPANGAGWNKTDVVVTFTCADQPGLSGLASCTTPQTVTHEGLDQPVVGTAVDNAGNSATDTASVSVDKIKPTISGTPDSAPNANGWYNADVSVGFTCADALSGIASCTTPVTLGEGAAQSVTGTAVDAAGNSDTATVDGIDVDETAPAISGTPTTAPNAHGWYQGDVTIHWTCSDALSGIDGTCPADSVITGEGDNLSATASIDDKAGNHSSATVDGLKIDRVAPTTTSDAPSDWQNADVSVSLTAHDGLSGVETTRYAIDGGPAHDGTTVAIAGEDVHALVFWSIDLAGNEETHHTQTVRIDKTAPSIDHTQSPPSNAHGWSNAPVEVGFHCADALSGVASCSDATTLANDGASQTVVGTAVDNAANSASDTATVNIDQTKPTISAARDRAPNANDWYNANVTVSFTCADGLSGIASCTAPHALGEGAAQSASGTAADLAGNSDSVTESGVNVDKTSPTIGGAPTTAPNANGWYQGDVTIHWTCNDPLSGIDGACPADSLITSEGDNLSASASVSDRAGNTSTASVAGIKIDRTAPSTSASAPSAWVNNDVTVTLSPSDALSGVATTSSSLDGALAHTGTTVSIATEGVHTLEYWSVDNAGNEEPHSTIAVRIDKSNPTITHSQSPVPNTNGWNNASVTVTFDCADQGNLSGIASCTLPQTTTTEGQGQVVTGVAHDIAGNSATDSATLNIDKTPPTITGAPDRAPNAAGWYRDDVTVTFTCGDALAGIDSCTSPVTRGQGAAQSVAGNAVDAAGNSAHATVDHLNVDKTPPTITGAPTTAPNANGWYQGDVTIHWTCGDALSGIDGTCPPDSVITGEGGALSASASVSDVAGNVASATVDHIKSDRTAPVTASDAPVGWRNADVTIHLSASDNLSGIGATYSRIDGGAVNAGSAVTISAQGTHNVEFWSVDAAGNGETHHTAVVQLDKTKPSITGAPTTSPNAAGWYHTPVTVHFTCADQAGLSGLASCTNDQTVATSGASQSVTGTALDNAGNSNSYTVSGLKVDLVQPTVAISSVADGASYELGAVPTPSCAAVDTLSGPAGCTGVVAGGTANGVGTYTYTATGRDVAGNATTRVVTYRAIYSFGGFLQPINDTAHQVGVNTSIFQAGSTVPVKFEIHRANGTTVSANATPQWLTPVKGSSLSAAVDESVYSAPSTSGDTYRVAGSQYIYNWSTKGLPTGYYYRIGVRLDDGTTYTVNIGLR
jgi:large repetitive protein